MWRKKFIPDFPNWNDSVLHLREVLLKGLKKKMKTWFFLWKGRKNFHILILRNCEDITLPGKRDFATVIELRILR